MTDECIVGLLKRRSQLFPFNFIDEIIIIIIIMNLE